MTAPGAFAALGAHRVVAHCNPENPASWRVLERVGLRREGIAAVMAVMHIHGNQCYLGVVNEFVVKLGSNGRLVIPAAVRRALGVTEGDDLSLALVDDELRVTTIRAAVRRAQRLMAQRVPAERSLADELIAERRAAAVNE